MRVIVNIAILLVAFLEGVAFSGKVYALEANKYAIGGIASAAALEAFVNELKTEVKQNRAEAVAKKVRFPVGAYVIDRRIVVNNEEEFVRNFFYIFTPSLRAALTCQFIDDLFVNSDGVRIGAGGELWVSSFKNNGATVETIKIYRINNNPWPKRLLRGDEQCYRAEVERIGN